jgi:hypothetical protein
VNPPSLAVRIALEEAVRSLIPLRDEDDLSTGPLDQGEIDGYVDSLMLGGPGRRARPKPAEIRSKRARLLKLLRELSVECRELDFDLADAIRRSRDSVGNFVLLERYQRETLAIIAAIEGARDPGFPSRMDFLMSPPELLAYWAKFVFTMMTGHEPKRSNRQTDDGLEEAGGQFHDFLRLVFRARGVTASAEHYARLAIERDKKLKKLPWYGVEISC